jgi:WD40 repeat protein
VVTGNADGKARVWSLLDGTLISSTSPSHDRGVMAVTCHDMDDQVTVAVTTGFDGSARVWNLRDGVQRLVLPKHVGQVGAVACHQLDRGTAMGVTLVSERVRMWDLRDGSGRTLFGHDSAALAVACLRLDELESVAVTAGEDGTVIAWDMRRGVELRKLTGHIGPVRNVVCRWIGTMPVAITAGDDGTVRIWNLADGRAVALLPCPSPVGALAAYVDGTIVAGFGWDVACYGPSTAPGRSG